MPLDWLRTAAACRLRSPAMFFVDTGISEFWSGVQQIEPAWSHLFDGAPSCSRDAPRQHAHANFYRADGLGREPKRGCPALRTADANKHGPVAKRAPPRCLRSCQFRFWSRCSAPSGRSRVFSFSNSCSSARRSRRRYWCARSRRGARARSRCAATTSGRLRNSLGALKAVRSRSFAFVHPSAIRLHTAIGNGHRLRAASRDSPAGAAMATFRRANFYRRKHGKLFPNFSSSAGTNPVGHGLANVAKRASLAVNGSRYVPDSADFLCGHAALCVGRDRLGVVPADPVRRRGPLGDGLGLLARGLELPGSAGQERGRRGH